jgi:hypothetical protein
MLGTFKKIQLLLDFFKWNFTTRLEPILPKILDAEALVQRGMGRGRRPIP